MTGHTMPRNEALEISYHNMRGAITLLTELGIAAIPQNYAVCYEYVSGENEDLRTAMVPYVEGGLKLNNEICHDFFHRYVLQLDEKHLGKLQRNVIKMLMDVKSDIDSVNSDASQFEQTLKQQEILLNNKPALEVISAIVTNLQTETGNMRASGEKLQSQLTERLDEVEKLRHDLEKAKHEANIDYLTGLYNRKALVNYLTDAIEAEARLKQGLCLLLIDIDHFKQFNDTYGHLLGDRVLKFVSNAMKKTLRGKDIIGRYGGEEFIVLLHETPYEGAFTVAENIRLTIAGTRLVRTGTKEELPPIHVSIGVASYRPGETSHDLIDRADKALYQSKENGRNQVTGEEKIG
jgi:diguanylate cyclase